MNITVKITERSLLRRINRKLAKEGKRLRKSREGSLDARMGTYLLFGPAGQVMGIEDVVSLARDIGVAA